MAYLLYSLCVFFIVTATAVFLTRSYWSFHVHDLNVPGTGHLYSRLPSSFASDIEAGLSSSTFNLSDNVEGGDSRAGLDEINKAEILKIMKRKRMTFDQARKAYIETLFKANGIGADGQPRDPKFVSFS